MRRATQELLNKRENMQHREDTGGGFKSLVSEMALLIFEPVKKRVLCQLAVLLTKKVLCVRFYNEIGLVRAWYGVLYQVGVRRT